MDTQVCFKCNRELPLSEFYRHAGMKLKVLRKCKECCIKYSKEFRDANIEYYREYDRQRGCRQNKDDLKAYRAKYPERARAHRMVNYAKRMGYLKKQPCEVCGETYRVNAHHDDYSKPLEVRWLCYRHHHEHHKNENRKAG